jgi:nicotinamidase-related amidase
MPAALRIDPDRDLLLVVDVQNDFCQGGALAVVELDHGAQTLWPDHCVQGMRGADFHPRLRIDHAELVIRKGFRRDVDSYSDSAIDARAQGFEAVVLATVQDLA